MYAFSQKFDNIQQNNRKGRMMNDTYIMVCSEYNGKISYGIALTEKVDDRTIILRTISDISLLKNAVEQLVKLCNELYLDPIHLDDVIEDFLAEF